MTILKSDICWVAGVLDQQGYFIRRNNKTRATPQISLTVETRHLEVVKELCDLTGIQVQPSEESSAREWNRRGCAEHCPKDDKHVQVHHDNWQMPRTDRWSVTGVSVAVILFNCIPYMIEDRDFRSTYAEILNNTATSGQGFHAVKTALLRLRDIGWSMPTPFRRLDLDY